ncbi:hypothetical protein EJB05_35265, partial [Eragrostis curvula]
VRSRIHHSTFPFPARSVSYKPPPPTGHGHSLKPQRATPGEREQRRGGSRGEAILLRIRSLDRPTTLGLPARHRRAVLSPTLAGEG